MALPTQFVALLLEEHAREPFTGPVLAYGAHELNVTFDDALWMFESLGLRPDPGVSIDHQQRHRPIDFAQLVKLMGLGELAILDELAKAFPPEWREHFGTIVDAGAMVHVFDLRQGMVNTADLLRTGGRVVHFSPVNNYLNAGFVQFSPTFCHDYYSANAFEDVRGIMIVQPRDGADVRRWTLFAYDHDTMGGCNSLFCTGETQLAGYFTARKTVASTSALVPLQSYFARLNEGKDPLPYQFVISYDPSKPNVRQFADPKAKAGAIAVFTPVWTLAGGGNGAG